MAEWCGLYYVTCLFQLGDFQNKKTGESKNKSVILLPKDEFFDVS